MLSPKLAKLCDILEINLVKAGHHQKSAYDHQSTIQRFAVDNCVWLSITTEITDSQHTKIVPVNQLRHCLQTTPRERAVTKDRNTQPWSPPWADHYYLLPQAADPPIRRYLQHERRPPDSHGLGRITLCE